MQDLSGSLSAMAPQRLRRAPEPPGQSGIKGMDRNSTQVRNDLFRLTHASGSLSLGEGRGHHNTCQDFHAYHVLKSEDRVYFTH